MDTKQESDPWWKRLPPVVKPQRTDACAICGHTRDLHRGRLSDGPCKVSICGCVHSSDWRISLFIGKPEQVTINGVEMDCFLAPPW